MQIADASDSFPSVADVHAMHPRCARCGEPIPTPEDAAHDERPARLKHATDDGCRQALETANGGRAA